MTALGNQFLGVAADAGRNSVRNTHFRREYPSLETYLPLQGN